MGRCEDCGALLFRGWCPNCNGCYICGDEMELGRDGRTWICPGCGWRCAAEEASNSPTGLRRGPEELKSCNENPPSLQN